MKILPDYLIEMMPALEEAMEELRLSVIDHAYELLKCLDVDELSSDDIRAKLELYDLKVDNMVEEWLPNGKFYRLYPEIKHNRTRLNSLKSVVCSGGQFEGLWSDEFIKEAEFNYNKIHTVRHYTIESEYDGYFYVSGNVSRTYVNGQDLVLDSTLTALSTDILLGQAMPAGYTYLYIPWPRPLYPSDSGYFYNVNMLNADRLHYALDCDTTDSYDESKPASLNYDWENGTNTPWRTPYWFDYHFMDNMTHTDPIEPQLETDDRYAGTWPIHEKGEYGNYNEEGGWEPCSPEDARFYVLDASCSILNDPNATFPTRCYIRSSNRTTAPNDSQIFVPRILDDNEEIFTIDCNNVDDITKQDLSNNGETPGTYRWDHLFDKGLQIIQEMSHIKTYKPIWSESSPVFAMVQSYLNSGLNPESVAEHSFYNWFELKRQENIQSAEESTIRDNNPSISEITHTSYDRPTSAYISSLAVAYTRASDDNQGYNKVITDDVADNLLYDQGESVSSLYNPELQYILVTLNSEVDGSQVQYTDNVNMVLEGDPSTGSLYLNKYTDTGHSQDDSYNYVTYKTSHTHKMWLSQSQQDVSINQINAMLYNNMGATNVYRSAQIKKIDYSLVGVYDSDNCKVDLDGLKELSQTYIGNNEYGITFTAHRVYTALQIAYYKVDWLITDPSQDSNANLGNDYFYFKSNQISDSQSTTMSASVIANTDTTISYSIKNDSEYNLDYIRAFLDGVEIATARYKSNEWVNFDVNLTKGQHTIQFIYTKDGAASSGADAGYIAIPKSCIDEDTLTYIEIVDEPVEFTAAYILFTARATDEYLPVPPEPPEYPSNIDGGLAYLDGSNNIEAHSQFIHLGKLNITAHQTETVTFIKEID